MKKSFFVSAVLLLLTGFEVSPTHLPVRAENPTPTVTESSKPEGIREAVPTILPQLELIDRGSFPRQRLLFTPTVFNQKEILTMTMDMDMVITVEGEGTQLIDMPAIEMTIETEITSIDANGDIHVNALYSGMDVVAEPKVSPELVENLRSAIQTIVGLKISFISDPQGKIKAQNFVLPDTIEPNIKQMFEQITSSLSELSAPMPSEAVGIGAQWRVFANPSINDIQMNHTVLYELVNIEENVITLDTSIEQQGEPQSIEMPRLPANTTLNLTNSYGQGQGRVTMNLTKMMPILANLSMDSNTEMQMQITENGQVEARNVKMKMLMQMTMQSH